MSLGYSPPDESLRFMSRVLKVLPQARIHRCGDIESTLLDFDLLSVFNNSSWSPITCRASTSSHIRHGMGGTQIYLFRTCLLSSPTASCITLEHSLAEAEGILRYIKQDYIIPATFGVMRGYMSVLYSCATYVLCSRIFEPAKIHLRSGYQSSTLRKQVH